MKPKHDGKSPSKLWYALQYLEMPFHKETRPELKSPAIFTGISVGSGVLTKTVLLGMASSFVGTLLGGPIIAAAGVGVCAVAGFIAYKKIRGLDDKPAVAKYIRGEEKEWLEKKSRPSRRKRLASAIVGVIPFVGSDDKKPSQPKKLEPVFQASSARSTLEQEMEAARQSVARSPRP